MRFNFYIYRGSRGLPPMNEWPSRLAEPIGPPVRKFKLRLPRFSPVLSGCLAKVVARLAKQSIQPMRSGSICISTKMKVGLFPSSALDPPSRAANASVVGRPSSSRVEGSVVHEQGGD